MPPAGLLVNNSDDAWFGRSIGPAQHFEIARMRALETARVLLRVDNTAITGIVGPEGEVTARATPDEPGVVTGTVQAREGLTPFARFGQIPLLLLFAVLAVGLVVGRRLQRRSSR